MGLRTWRTAFLIALFALVGLGCGAAGAGQQVRLLRVGDPLKEPVWVPNDALIALSEDGRRVERIDFGASESSRIKGSEQVFIQSAEDAPSCFPFWIQLN